MYVCMSISTEIVESNGGWRDIRLKERYLSDADFVSVIDLAYGMRRGRDTHSALH